MQQTAASPNARFAARCRYLRTTLSREEPGHLANSCRHLVRDGSPCVGPFLDEFETDCGFWEPATDDPIRR